MPNKRTGQDYLDAEKKKAKPKPIGTAKGKAKLTPLQNKKKSGIDPKSIPGRVLTERKKNPGPPGSRSNPWPPGTPAWKRGGFKNKGEYDKLDQKYKDMLN